MGGYYRGRRAHRSPWVSLPPENYQPVASKTTIDRTQYVSYVLLLRCPGIMPSLFYFGVVELPHEDTTPLIEVLKLVILVKSVPYIVSTSTLYFNSYFMITQAVDLLVVQRTIRSTEQFLLHLVPFFLCRKTYRMASYSDWSHGIWLGRDCYTDRVIGLSAASVQTCGCCSGLAPVL